MREECSAERRGRARSYGDLRKKKVREKAQRTVLKKVTFSRGGK